MLSAFIVCVACATAASRTLFAMGREGVLPKAFGHTSPRFKTPVNATIAVAVVATVMALLVGYPFSDSDPAVAAGAAPRGGRADRLDPGRGRRHRRRTPR